MLVFGACKAGCSSCARPNFAANAERNGVHEEHTKIGSDICFEEIVGAGRPRATIAVGGRWQGAT